MAPEPIASPRSSEAGHLGEAAGVAGVVGAGDRAGAGAARRAGLGRAAWAGVPLDSISIAVGVARGSLLRDRVMPMDLSQTILRSAPEPAFA
jgi:hypothetical protein